MVDDSHEARIRRIRGLLDKANATNSEAEREACISKAMRLMAKYGIEDAQLNAAASGGREKIILHHLHPPLGAYERQRYDLLASIATPLRCAVIRQTRAGDQPLAYTLVGHERDVERVKLLFSYLDAYAVSHLAGLETPPGEGMVRYRRDWLRGFCISVNVRLQDIEGQVAEEATRSTPGTDLILADRLHQVLGRVREAFGGGLRALEFEQVSMNRASLAGFAAGERVDLGGHGRVGESSRKGLGR